MIHHVSIGVRDIPAARRFYDKVLRPLGYKCLSESAESLGYGNDSPAFWVNVSQQPVPADERSGLHICFAAPTRKGVDDFHAAGIAAGGRDNGRPGLRPDYGPGYYAAFLCDTAGYRIEAYVDEQGS